MRKTLKVLLMAFLLLLISSCGKSDELGNFTKAFSDYNYSKTTGYLYTSKQSFNNALTNEKRIEQQIDRGSPLKAQTDFYEKKLNEFDKENQFTITSYSTYYLKDSAGKEEGEDIIWKKQSFKDYNNMSLPKLSFKKDYFSEYTLNKLADYILLKGYVKDDKIKDFFNLDEEMTNIYIEARIRGKTLHEFKIRYTLENSLIDTSYRIYYEKYELNIEK